MISERQQSPASSPINLDHCFASDVEDASRKIVTFRPTRALFRELGVGSELIVTTWLAT